MSYEENHAVYKFEGVPQHEVLHFSVVLSSPMRTRQKRPADLNFSILGFVSAIPRGTNDPLRLPVDGSKCSSRIQGLAKKLFEDFFFVAIVGWVLFPYYWIRSDKEQIGPVFCSQRPKLEKLTDKVWL
jgi:hypothetical protein